MKLCKGAIWPHRYNDISKDKQLQESNGKLKYLSESCHIRNFTGEG